MKKKNTKKKPSSKDMMYKDGGMMYKQGGAMAALADAIGKGNAGSAPGQEGQVAPRGNVVQRVQNFNDPQHGSKGVPMEGKKVEHKQPGTTTMASPPSQGQASQVSVGSAAQGAMVMGEDERKKKMMQAMMGQQPGMMQFGAGQAGANPAAGMPGAMQEKAPQSPGPARPHRHQELKDDMMGDGGLVDPIDAMMSMRRNRRFRKKKNG